MSKRRLGLLGLLLFATGCQPDTLLGFAIGDIGGLWTASSFEYVRVSDRSERVDIVARDGALFTLSVDDSVQPATVGATLRGGSGGDITFSGTVDLKLGVLTLNGDTFTIDDNGEAMSLTNEIATYDFGNGAVPVEVVIRLNRV